MASVPSNNGLQQCSCNNVHILCAANRHRFFCRLQFVDAYLKSKFNSKFYRLKMHARMQFSARRIQCLSIANVRNLHARYVTLSLRYHYRRISAMVSRNLQILSDLDHALHHFIQNMHQNVL
jgi:hypothetical protein